MDKLKRAALILFIVALIVLFTGQRVVAIGESQRDQLEALHREMNRQNEVQSDLSSKIDALQKQNTEQADTIAEKSAEVEQLKQDLAEVRNKENF